MENNMITEDYVSFETAKLLKEKGFDEECQQYYGDYKYPCPTPQMAMKWLRKTHNIVMYIIPNTEFENEYDVHVKVKWFIGKWAGVGFKSYELACEAGIKYCIKNLI